MLILVFKYHFLKGTSALWKNGSFQARLEENTESACNILWCQEVRKYSKNDRDMSKGQEPTLKSFHWPNLGQFKQKNK